MANIMVIQGRHIGEGDLDLIRGLLAHEHYLGHRNTVGKTFAIS